MDFSLTKESKLLHDNNYLKERVTNLEVFKKNFFSLHMELIEAKEKITLYEEQIQLDQLKGRISGLPDSFDESVNRGDGLNDGLLVFFKESFLANEYRDVIASVFSSIDGLDLNVTLQIITDRETLNHSLDAKLKESDLELISQYRDKQEFYSNDDFAVFNYKYISLLARNLPLNDELKLTQVLKFLEIIAMGANLRVGSLYDAVELDLLHRNIYKVFSKTHASFESMLESYDYHAIAVSEFYLGFEANLEASLNKINLSEGHAKLIKMILYDARMELNLLLTSGMTTDEAFIKSIEKLEKVYSSKYSTNK